LRPFLYILAGIRGIVAFGMMSLYITAYGVSCIFVPHTRKRALKLRENYIKNVAIPILNIHIDVQGKPIDTPALYVCNHRSFSDPVAVCRYLPAFVLAKAEVANYPIINKGAELTGVIWVNRSNKTSRSDARSKLIETIHTGNNILLYPEGTVGKEKTTLPFREGSFNEAAENNIPIIPIAIEYKSSKDLWIKEKFIPQYFYQFSKWQTSIKLHFGEPIIDTDGKKLCSLSQQWINEQLIVMQKNWKEDFL
jgi:1-acyl-sn-glycerol-3-phosphate acyltransferase